METNALIANGDALLALLPQRPPIVLISALLASDGTRTVSSYRVPAAGLLVEHGHLSEAGLVENIAQTAAAGVGYHCQQLGQPTPIGFIAAIKDLQISALPPVGTELITEVLVQNQVLEFTIVRGTVRAGETTFASCEMRIFVKDPA